MQASESLLLVYAICFLIATSHLLIKSTLLPFLNELSYSTGTNASFYFYSTAMHLLLRSPLTALAGELSVHFGTVKTMRFTISASLVGLLLMLTSRLSKAMFLIGYLLTASLITTRVLRVLMLSDLVSSHDRTTALNAHESVQLSSLFSAPLVWLGAQKWGGQVAILPGVFVLDRFSLCHMFAMLLLFVALACVLRLQRLQSGDGGHDTSEPLREDTGADYGSVRQQGNAVWSEAALESVPEAFLFFLALTAVCRVPKAVSDASFQPILVNIYAVSDERLGHLYLAAASFALTVTLSFTVASRRMSNQRMLAIGLAVKALGAADWNTSTWYIRT